MLKFTNRYAKNLVYLQGEDRLHWRKIGYYQ